MRIEFTVQGETKGRVIKAAAERLNEFLGIEGVVAEPVLPEGTHVVARPLVESFNGGVEMWEADVSAEVA